MLPGTLSTDAVNFSQLTTAGALVGSI